MKRFKNILVATDTRFESHPIVAEAIELAARNGAALKIIDSLPEFAWPVRASVPDHEHLRQLMIDEKHQKLNSLAAAARDRGINVETKVLLGKASLEIIREVQHGSHDLVMRVAKGQASRQSGYFGRTGIVLLRKCPCPVWLVAPGATPEFKHVAGCVDTSSGSEADVQLNDRVYELASTISTYHESRFSLLHVWSIYGEALFRGRMSADEFAAVEHDCQQHTEQCLDKFLAKHGSSIRDEHVHLLKGEPPIAIADYVRANGVDLLVMGTVARSGMSGMIMGNTAEQILGRIECSVLALKPEGFASPVQVGQP